MCVHTAPFVEQANNPTHTSIPVCQSPTRLYTSSQPVRPELTLSVSSSSKSSQLTKYSFAKLTFSWQSHSCTSVQTQTCTAVWVKIYDCLRLHELRRAGHICRNYSLEIIQLHKTVKILQSQMVHSPQKSASHAASYGACKVQVARPCPKNTAPPTQHNKPCKTDCCWTLSCRHSSWFPDPKYTFCNCSQVKCRWRERWRGCSQLQS